MLCCLSKVAPTKGHHGDAVDDYAFVLPYKVEQPIEGLVHLGRRPGSKHRMFRPGVAGPEILHMERPVTWVAAGFELALQCGHGIDDPGSPFSVGSYNRIGRNVPTAALFVSRCIVGVQVANGSGALDRKHQVDRCAAAHASNRDTLREPPAWAVRRDVSRSQGCQRL